MGRRAVVLDCSALADADAGQLEGIARLCLRLKRSGCALRLANPSERLLELIELAGLASVLEVWPDL
jgi:ABC-type transporter Mla MlaB component